MVLHVVLAILILLITLFVNVFTFLGSACHVINHMTGIRK